MGFTIRSRLVALVSFEMMVFAFGLLSSNE